MTTEDEIFYVLLSVIYVLSYNILQTKDYFLFTFT